MKRHPGLADGEVAGVSVQPQAPRGCAIGSLAGEEPHPFRADVHHAAAGGQGRLADVIGPVAVGVGVLKGAEILHKHVPGKQAPGAGRGNVHQEIPGFSLREFALTQHPAVRAGAFRSPLRACRHRQVAPCGIQVCLTGRDLQDGAPTSGGEGLRVDFEIVAAHLRGGARLHYAASVGSSRIPAEKGDVTFLDHAIALAIGNRRVHTCTAQRHGKRLIQLALGVVDDGNADGARQDIGWEGDGPRSRQIVARGVRGSVLRGPVHRDGRGRGLREAEGEDCGTGAFRDRDVTDGYFRGRPATRHCEQRGQHQNEKRKRSRFHNDLGRANAGGDVGQKKFGSVMAR